MLAWVERIGFAVAIAAMAFFALAVFGLVPLAGETRDLWLYNAITIAVVCVVTVHAVRDRTERLAWVALDFALICTLSGDLYYSLEVVNADPAPYPSWADVAYVLFYVWLYVSLIRMVRHRIPRWHPSLWLDGLIIALSVAALSVTFVLEPLLGLADDQLLVVLTNLAYPVGDLMLICTVVLGAWLLGARLDRSWVLLGAGALAMGVGDIIFLLQVSQDSYTEGTPLDITWVAGAVLMAGAAVARRPSGNSEGASFGPGSATATDGRSTPAEPRWALLVVPVFGTVSSLGFLLPWAGWERPPLGQWLAAGVLFLSALRLAFREVWALADARRQAMTDELTGLMNRRAFTAAAQGVLPPDRPDMHLDDDQRPTDPRGCGPAGAALMMVDLDRFKEVNDSLGHVAGDELLAGLARCLADSCRGPRDLVARLGGDEFALLLPDAGRTGAEQVAGRITAALATPFLLEGVQVEAGVSIGIAVAPCHGRTLSLLMRRADIAMYRAKTTHCGYTVYDPDLHDPASEDRLQRVEELRTAIEEGRIGPHYQPKIDLSTGEVNSVEALARWEHPTLGLVPPSGFLPLAAEAGLMPALTATVLDQALAQVATWRDEGRDLHVAVNLTPADVVDTGLPQRITDLLARHEVPATMLQLEITEESLLGDRVRARDVLARLRASGIRIAIDDYGTGYSSLAYLRELPVDELKIDRSFILPMMQDGRAAAIVRSTIELAHSLGLCTVAEGVEHADAADELTRYGCDIAQGFHYAPALRPAQFRQWLDHRKSGTPPEESQSTSTLIEDAAELSR